MIRKLPHNARLVRGGPLRLPMPNPAALDDASRFAWSHLWLPLLAWALAVCTIGVLDIDWRLSHALYAWEGYRWLLRDATLTETLLHRGGHALSVVAWLATLAAWIFARRRRSVLRRPLAFLLLSVLASTLLVSWVKSWSNMDCPWDIDGLGGTRPYLDLLSARPSGLPQAGAFPPAMPAAAMPGSRCTSSSSRYARPGAGADWRSASGWAPCSASPSSCAARIFSRTTCGHSRSAGAWPTRCGRRC